jgi:RHS repeat-associated protein
VDNGGGGGRADYGAFGGVGFGFAAMRYDAAAGLDYDRARWYVPATGRFVSRDPIGFGGGDTNLYRYVGNEPELYADPSGLEIPPSAVYPDDPRHKHGPATGIRNASSARNIVYLYDLDDKGKKNHPAHGFKQKIGNCFIIIANGNDFRRAVTPWPWQDPSSINSVTTGPSLNTSIDNLEQYVLVHGPIDELHVYDHGSEDHQAFGKQDVVGTPDELQQFERLNKLMSGHARVHLYGCSVGQNHYKFLNHILGHMSNVKEIIAHKGDNYWWPVGPWTSEPVVITR